MTFFVDGIHICPSWYEESSQLTWHLSQWHHQYWRWSIRQALILWKWKQAICLQMRNISMLLQGDQFFFELLVAHRKHFLLNITTCWSSFKRRWNELYALLWSASFQQHFETNIILHLLTLTRFFFTSTPFRWWCSVVNGNVARCGCLIKMSFNIIKQAQKRWFSTNLKHWTEDLPVIVFQK